jgi:hypothetical protein
MKVSAYLLLFNTVDDRLKTDVDATVNSGVLEGESAIVRLLASMRT